MNLGNTAALNQKHRLPRLNGLMIVHSAPRDPARKRRAKHGVPQRELRRFQTAVGGELVGARDLQGCGRFIEPRGRRRAIVGQPLNSRVLVGGLRQLGTGRSQPSLRAAHSYPVVARVDPRQGLSRDNGAAFFHFEGHEGTADAERHIDFGRRFDPSGQDANPVGGAGLNGDRLDRTFGFDRLGPPRRRATPGEQDRRQGGPFANSREFERVHGEVSCEDAER